MKLEANPRLMWILLLICLGFRLGFLGGMLRRVSVELSEGRSSVGRLVMFPEGLDEFREKLRRDPVVFAEAVLGFHAYPYRAELLHCPSKRIVACWARLTGKTTAIAVKVIHHWSSCFVLTE